MSHCNYAALGHLSFVFRELHIVEPHFKSSIYVKKTLVSLFFRLSTAMDVILIQEVRDSDLSATNRLMEHVNKLD